MSEQVSHATNGPLILKTSNVWSSWLEETEPAQVKLQSSLSSNAFVINLSGLVVSDWMYFLAASAPHCWSSSVQRLLKIVTEASMSKVTAASMDQDVSGRTGPLVFGVSEHPTTVRGLDSLSCHMTQVQPRLQVLWLRNPQS